MSTSSHWFVIWVPSGPFEKKQRSKNKTETSDIERSCPENENQQCSNGDERDIQEEGTEIQKSFVVTKIDNEINDDKNKADDETAHITSHSCSRGKHR